ncbi:5-(carboxyamino)imidazole ribonucleotide mutase [Methanosphaera sp. ISO3-F5]|uniref:5-(carboxyamino)imidazole ribonucleotide mutase n=1 Tax=Methanosphaera sp. ISO3-F5 TaxID=1452353 RepID=UPI002B25EE08|nr:5-(carboxyamino)imidazole ribonucleotide mutase [Methanosphaera sp. ISO3-F5]WQH64831.1 5-(carboxyamino)imidazole ribonucleotide mutase [Methanosphaera sp. ISO3-F5]
MYDGGNIISQSKVMIVLGSASDYKVAQKAVNVFEEMNINYDLRVASAHRTHQRLKEIIVNETEEVEVIIAIAGLAAHLPGVVAAYTTKPVIAVPVDVKLGGLDSLLSSTEMQLGTPIATMGIDRGDNAAWLACQIIACNDEEMKNVLKEKRNAYNAKMQKSEEELIEKIAGKHYRKTALNKQEVVSIDKEYNLDDDTKVVIISGNYSNMETVRKIIQTLETLKIKCEYKVISATRDPYKLEKYIEDIDENVDLYIAVSSLSTILTGAIVSLTTKPVIGVPCTTRLSGVDSLLSMIEMPPGVPVATMGLDAGENAALFVARIFSIYDDDIRNELLQFMKTLHRNVYYE